MMVSALFVFKAGSPMGLGSSLKPLCLMKCIAHHSSSINIYQMNKPQITQLLLISLVSCETSSKKHVEGTLQLGWQLSTQEADPSHPAGQQACRCIRLRALNQYPHYGQENPGPRKSKEGSFFLQVGAQKVIHEKSKTQICPCVGKKPKLT